MKKSSFTPRRGKNYGGKAKKTKKFVDIERMLDDDSDDGLRRPTQLINEELKRNDSEIQEDQDKVLPLPGSIGIPSSKKTSKKTSNIKMKKIRKPMYKNQNTYGPNSNDSHSTYERQYSRMDSVPNYQNNYQNSNNYNKYSNNFNTSFQFDKYPKPSKQQTLNFESKENPFKKAFDKFGPAAPVLATEETDVVQESNINIFDDLKYGSSITLNLIDENEGCERKLNTKLRISDTINATKMESDDYNINCLFKIIPASQHLMQDKILDIIETDDIPGNIEIEYENFISEVESNSAAYQLSSGNSVRFEDTFQLYQDSSKRYL